MPRRKKVIPTVDKSVPKPSARVAHPELVTECKEAGKGWRRDQYGDWWPCSEQDAQREEQDRAAD